MKKSFARGSIDLRISSQAQYILIIGVKIQKPSNDSSPQAIFSYKKAVQGSPNVQMDSPGYFLKKITEEEN